MPCVVVVILEIDSIGRSTRARRGERGDGDNGDDCDDCDNGNASKLVHAAAVCSVYISCISYQNITESGG